jgi:hypothetical protein
MADKHGMEILKTRYASWYWNKPLQLLMRASKMIDQPNQEHFLSERDNTLVGATKMAASREYRILLEQQKHEVAA